MKIFLFQIAQESVIQVVMVAHAVMVQVLSAVMSPNNFRLAAMSECKFTVKELV